MNDVRKAIERYGKRVSEEKMIKACNIAKDKVQDDFNNEIVDFVAAYTGHPNLSQTVFLEVELESIDLKVNKYTDENFIVGLFSSHSSLHPGFEGWNTKKSSILSGMSRSEFWELKEEGYEFGNHGGVSSEWLTDNFWKGIIIGTNGWPRGSDEFLAVYRSHDASGENAVKQYIAEYISDGRYLDHIIAALNKT